MSSRHTADTSDTADAARRSTKRRQRDGAGASARQPARPYHHGKLRQALIDMAVVVAEETGKDLISVREVARRLGVSSGAPFRHFPDREALMTAVAEEATMRLRLRAERDLMDAPPRAMTRLKVLGRSFIEWALSHPTQFRLVSSRRLFDFDGSASLGTHFGVVRGMTLALVRQAQAEGDLPAGAADELALGLRALVYGLTRMQVDGQLAQWQVPPAASAETLIRTMDLLLDGLSQRAPAAGQDAAS
ncbi:MAG: TetR/AcrR family transcriptional regulator [Aquabacterium sp.]